MSRFLAIRTISNFLIFSGLFFLLADFGPLAVQVAWYKIRQIRGINYTLEKIGAVPETEVSPFGVLMRKYPPIRVDPVSMDFSVVIEKIGVNAPIVGNVNVASYKEYFESLKSGVAHAGGSPMPGESGNTYLFAHSALDFWNFGKYAKVFTLLGQVEAGDRIVIFYQGKRFDYIIEKKEIFKGFDLTPLLRTYAEPTLTLQTCDPPGTALNRLIVTAKLVKEGTWFLSQRDCIKVGWSGLVKGGQDYDFWAVRSGEDLIAGHRTGINLRIVSAIYLEKVNRTG